MYAYRMKKMAAFASGRVLDIGFAKVPNAYLKGSITGLDRQEVPIPRTYSSVVVGDISELCFAPESFDTLVAGELIEHLEQPIKFLHDCYEALRPGGRLVLSTPNPYYPPYIILNWLLIRKYFFSDDHLFAFTPRLLERLCKRAGFEVEGILSGGIFLPVLNRTIPFPRAICYQLIFVCRKPIPSD